MRQKPDVQIFSVAGCCFKDCPTPWAKWCRGCNLVFCGTHMGAHPCPERGGLGAPRKLPQDAQGLERGESKSITPETIKVEGGKH